MSTGYILPGTAGGGKSIIRLAREALKVAHSGKQAEVGKITKSVQSTSPQVEWRGRTASSKYSLNLAAFSVALEMSNRKSGRNRAISCSGKEISTPFIARKQANDEP